MSLHTRPVLTRKRTCLLHNAFSAHFFRFKVWTDADAATVRTYVGHRVLDLCRKERRGRLATRLVQLGSGLAVKNGRRGAYGTWPGKHAFHTAMQAVSRILSREEVPEVISRRSIAIFLSLHADSSVA